MSTTWITIDEYDLDGMLCELEIAIIRHNGDVNMYGQTCDVFAEPGEFIVDDVRVLYVDCGGVGYTRASFPEMCRNLDSRALAHVRNNCDALDLMWN
jgi:hypothetical protein